MQEKTAEKPAIVMPRVEAATPDFLTLHEIIAKARANLNQNNWDYIVGGTETETTLRRNRMALNSIAFRPRVLRDVRKIDASTTVFGRKLRMPVMLAPVGSLECFHPEGAAPVARGAGAFGVAHMLSSVCDPGVKEIAECAADCTRIFQLYVRGDDAVVDGYVEAALATNCVAFCLTVDTAHYSRRERDIAKRHTTRGRQRVAGREFQAALDWRSVKRIRDKYKIPLILKGIATAEDARIAVEHGVEWVYISNHGGRQLDHGRGCIDVLPEVKDAVGGRAKILIDGGFYRGTDIVKAIAAGANLVGMGRMQCYALAAAGQAGVERMLELVEDEVQRCMGLLGATKLAELDASFLHPAAPVVTPPHVLSAFPLLKIEDYRY